MEDFLAHLVAYSFVAIVLWLVSMAYNAFKKRGLGAEISNEPESDPEPREIGTPQSNGIVAITTLQETPKPTEPLKATFGQKVAATCFFLLALVCAVVLLKTELRKWFAMEGHPSAANSLIFWLSLGGTFLFILIGASCLPNRECPTKKSDGTDAQD